MRRGLLGFSVADEGPGRGSWSLTMGVGKVSEGEKTVCCPWGGWVREGEYPGWGSGGREFVSEAPGGMFRVPRALGEGPGKSPRVPFKGPCVPFRSAGIWSRDLAV